MQNHARGIDDGLQRILKRDAHLLFDRLLQAGLGQIDTAGVEAAGRDFLAQGLQHGSRRISYRDLALLRQQRSQSWAAHELIHCREFSKKVRFGFRFHVE